MMTPNRKLKLALVSETFPPEINGVAMTLGTLVEGLSRRGFEITVWRPRQRPEDEARARAEFHREELCPGLPIPGYSLLRLGLPVRKRILDTWKQARPDLVHIATEGPLGWAALSAAQKLGIPVTSTFHTNFHSYSRDYGFAWLTRPALAYLRSFHNRTRLTLSPTEELNRELSAQGFANMRLLSRGVDTRRFSPNRRDEGLRVTWGAKPEDLVVIHVSRVAKEKNYGLLFDAWAAIRTRLPETKFVLVSDGPLRKKLQRQYPWVNFTGFLDRDQLATHYASANLFLYPSLTETFGNVVTEGLASGLPVVAFNYAAAARYINHTQNGWLVPLDNRDEFIQAGLQLAQSPDLRQQLGPAARKTAEDIPWDTVIDGFVRDLHEVCRNT